MKTGKLSAESVVVENKLGYNLYILFGEKKKRVPFRMDDVSRGATLITLRHILQPDYEVRFWMDCIGGDTLAFVPLSFCSYSRQFKTL